MTSPESTPKDLLRKSTEERIEQRLKTSNRIQNILFGVVLSVGAAAGVAEYLADDDERLVTRIGGGAGVVAMAAAAFFERRNAHNACLNSVTSYREVKRGEIKKHSSPTMFTEMYVGDEKLLDFDAIPKGRADDRVGIELTTAMGSWAVVSHAAMPEGAIGQLESGVIVTAASVVWHAHSQYVNTTVNPAAYSRMLDNIDNA